MMLKVLPPWTSARWRVRIFFAGGGEPGISGPAGRMQLLEQPDLNIGQIGLGAIHTNGNELTELGDSIGANLGSQRAS